MQLAAALLGLLGVFIPLILCEKNNLKIHINSTKGSTNKRWMSSFAQTFIKSQPVQSYSTHYSQDLYNGPPDTANHFDYSDSNMAPYDDTNFQGLKEIKVPKPNEVNRMNDASAMFASDIAQYLKPGIGDDPSDMPGGLKSYGSSLNGVGLPISGKLRSTKLTPVASFQEQTGLELNPHRVLLSPSSAVIPAVIADSIRSDSSTTKLLDEMPGKISEVSASIAESSKAFSGAGESPMIVSSSDSTLPISTFSATPDSSVTTQIDTNEPTNKQQSDKAEKAETISDKSKQDETGTITGSSEVKEDDPVVEKINKPGITNDSDQPVFKSKKVKQVSGQSVKSNGTAKKLEGNRRKNSEGDDAIDSTSNPMEISVEKDGSITVDSQSNSTNEEDNDDDAEKTPSKVKEKLVSSLREALLENVKEMLNGENSKQLLEEAQTVTDDKPVNLTNSQEEEEGSAESVIPVNGATGSHFDASNSKTIDDTDKKGIDDKTKKEVDDASQRKVDDTKKKEIDDTNKKEVGDANKKEIDDTKKKEVGDTNKQEVNDTNKKVEDDQPSNLLESNLMKINKKKLVHLLATLMKRYKSNGSPANDVDETEKTEEKRKGSVDESDDKVSDQIQESLAIVQGDQGPEAKSKEGKDSSKNESKEEIESKEEKESNEVKEANEKEGDHLQRENKQSNFVNLKHRENAVSRAAGTSAEFFDPYAQIGLTDPKVSGNPAISNRKVDANPTNRHSVHINLYGDDSKEKEKEKEKGNLGPNDLFKQSKEFEGKIETETQRAEEIVNEKVERQKARLEAQVQKAHNKESLENEELIKESHEMTEAAIRYPNQHDLQKENQKIEHDKETSETKQVENIKIAHMKPTEIFDDAKIIKTHQNGQLDEIDTEKSMGGTKNIEANEGSSTHGQMHSTTAQPEREKTETMKEEENVAVELLKEREELKMLKEQEKLERVKEEELKLANAELEERDKKERDKFLENVKQQQAIDEEQEETIKKPSQQKNKKEDATQKENFDKFREQQIKTEKSNEDAETKLKQIKENQLSKGTKSGAEMTAYEPERKTEKGEKEMGRVEDASHNQVDIENIIKNKLRDKKKESTTESFEEKGKEKSEKSMEAKKEGEIENGLEIKGFGKGEKHKDVKYISNESLKDNELKDVEMIIEEKEKKIKSMNKEKGEELKRKEMELKEAEKAATFDNKKSDKTRDDENRQYVDTKRKQDKGFDNNNIAGNHEDKDENLTKKKGKEDRGSERTNAMENYNRKDGRLEVTKRKQDKEGDNNNAMEHYNDKGGRLIETKGKEGKGSESNDDMERYDNKGGKSIEIKGKQGKGTNGNSVTESYDDKGEQSMKPREKQEDKEKEPNSSNSIEHYKTKSEQLMEAKGRQPKVAEVNSGTEDKNEQLMKVVDKEDKESENSNSIDHYKNGSRQSMKTKGKQSNGAESNRGTDEKVEQMVKTTGKQDKGSEETKIIESYKKEGGKGTENNHYINVVSPDLVNAIASRVPSEIQDAEREVTRFSDGPYQDNNIQNDGSREKNQSETQNGKTSAEEKDPVEEKLTLGESKTSHHEKEAYDEGGGKVYLDEKVPIEAKQDKLSRDTKIPEEIAEEDVKVYETKEKHKSNKLKEQEIKQKNEDFMAIDGPNIETLIAHMEERMRQKKKEKEISKEPEHFTKETKKKSHADDAYSQIGSFDPNVKRRRILKKSKKHYHHHHLKTAKHK